MASPRVRRRLRAWVAELLWRLGAVDTFEQFAALESRVARARAAACGDPPACRALALAHQQTSWRLANRLCGGLLESLGRVVALARSALDGLGRALAQLFAALTTPSARKAAPCPT